MIQIIRSFLIHHKPAAFQDLPRRVSWVFLSHQHNSWYKHLACQCFLSEKKNVPLNQGPTREHWKVKSKCSKQYDICKHFSKIIWRMITTTASIWEEISLPYLSLDILHYLKGTLFLEPHPWKTVPLFKQIISTDKYLCIRLCQMNVVAYVFLSFTCSMLGHLKIHCKN